MPEKQVRIQEVVRPRPGGKPITEGFVPPPPPPKKGK